MTRDTLAAALVDRGLDPAELEAKRLLFGSVLDAFPAFAGGTPTDAWWIPGRLEVFGKHTDYGGGHSLIATVPRGFALGARGRADGAIRLIDARRAQQVELAPPYADYSFSGWRHYAHAAAQRLFRNFPGASLGADIAFASDLPSASGMSSSSALVVGLVNALAHLAGLRDRVEWRANIRTNADAAGYYACFENGMAFGTLAGDAGVGTHGGSEDHVAIVCGEAAHVLAWKFVPIEFAGRAAVPPEWTFVIASSGVAAQKIGPAMAAYNSVSRRANALLELWNRSEARQPSLRAALHSHPAASDRLRTLLQHSGLDGPARSELEARLEHFLQEDARIPAALRAFADADREALTALTDASQRDTELLLGNQIPETIALAHSARDLGAFAASAFGAGFGGSVWALIERDRAAIFAEQWLDGYREAFPLRTSALTFLAPPGPPLTRAW
jgi:galactokinase